MLPSGNVPYQQYVFNNIYSYAREFKNQGYDTVGIHTYQKEFYERDRAYPLLGFDEMLGEYDLHAEQHFNSGPFLTDESLVEEIMYQLEQPHEKGVFIQGITMENHGLYLNKFDPSEWNIDFTSDALSEEESNLLHNYCKGVSDSDAQLRRLYDCCALVWRPSADAGERFRRLCLHWYNHLHHCCKLDRGREISDVLHALCCIQQLRYRARIPRRRHTRFAVSADSTDV